MSKHNTMTYKETVEELEFAIEHNLRFNKHDIERILPKEDIERIAKKFCLRAEYRPLFMSDIKACYVLIFGNIANYFSKDVISSDEGYTIEEKKTKQQMSTKPLIYGHRERKSNA